MTKLAFKAQVFVPHVGSTAWVRQDEAAHNLVLDHGYGGFLASVAVGGCPACDRYIFPTVQQARNFIASKTGFVVLDDAWPMAFAPTWVSQWLASFFLFYPLQHPRTGAVVGYLAFSE